MTARRLPVGAEPRDGGVHFRVWAPSAKRVEVVLPGAGTAHPLQPEKNGYYSGLLEGAVAGTRYLYRLDGGEARPDPASRRQPDGPHGPSEVVDPDAFSWTDAGWPGLSLEGQVISEVHVGTCTPGGTFRSLAEDLAAYREVGITALELMPVADFPGDFGWGYDGVALFAPYHGYGSPDDLRALVDRAHSLGIGIILDVVYNHLGPDGNWLPGYAPAYFSSRYETDWGEAINFDGPDSGPVREFYLANVAHWIGEYHMDGLRLDATQNIYDESPRHILKDIARAARRAAGPRGVLLIAENEPQQPELVRPEERGGYGLDLLWNDDFHHSTSVALLGRRDAYFNDYTGRSQELVSALKYGYLYQGQWYRWQRKRRGGPGLDLDPVHFVLCLENHDQAANATAGRRLAGLTSPACYRALTGVLLLAPGTPMLFQGQEFGSTRPFHFFADHEPELARAVFEGRRKFLHQFAASLASGQALVLDPGSRETFLSCKADPEERRRNQGLWKMHRDLLRLRRETPAFGAGGRDRFDGAVLSDSAFALRWFSTAGDRLLVVNLGADLRLEVAPEPLLAPPEDCAWEMEWTSEDVSYGGLGTPPLETRAGWRVPGQCAVLLRPGVRSDPPAVPLSQEDVR